MQMKGENVGYIAIVILLSITSLLSLNLFLPQRKAQDKLDIRVFPYQVGNWKGRDLPVTEKEYDILETRNLISREYVNRMGEKLHLFIIYSETNRAVFHPPEVCFLGSGVKIVDKKREEIQSGQDKFFVNKLYTEKGTHRGIALYCYKAGNLYTDNFYLQQAWFALNQLLGRHRGGATIRVSMAIRGDKGGKGEGVEEARVRILHSLQSFLAQTCRIIDTL